MEGSILTGKNTCYSLKNEDLTGNFYILRHFWKKRNRKWSQVDWNLRSSELHYFVS